MQNSKLLIAARAKVADERNWTRGEYARDASGKAISPTHELAVCWDYWGAVCAVGGECAQGALTMASLSPEFTDAISAAVTVRDRRPAVDINDTLGHRWVLRLFDSAIRIAEDMEKRGC